MDSSGGRKSRVSAPFSASSRNGTGGGCGGRKPRVSAPFSASSRKRIGGSRFGISRRNLANQPDFSETGRSRYSSSNREIVGHWLTSTRTTHLLLAVRAKAKLAQ